MQSTVTDKIVDQLLKYNINTYFIVTGGAIAPFVDSVGRNPNVKYYCFQHEQAAAMAAEGYYRASNKIAVVLVTSGPGVQNILNGVCGCWYDSIPCLFISGQVNLNESLDSVESKPRQVGFQEFPVEETFSACTKFCKKIRSEDDIVTVFNTALTTMTSGRLGPVLIDFPVNLQMISNTYNIELTIVNQPSYISSINIEGIIKKYNRPIILLGNGCRTSINNVKTWLEKSNIPFVTSWGGCDLIEHNHHLRIGNIGVYGDRIANYALQNSDILIVLGSRMDTRETGGNLKLCAREAFKIMVDIDEEEINKLNERDFKIDIPIVSSVESFITANNRVFCDIYRLY
jgi:acetolactate synthase-1/2/3 large subunit